VEGKLEEPSKWNGASWCAAATPPLEANAMELGTLTSPMNVKDLLEKERRRRSVRATCPLLVALGCPACSGATSAK